MRFVCDVMLGKLAKYLRALGFDATYVRNPKTLDQLLRAEEPAYFLTRRASSVSWERTIRIKANKVREQLRELQPFIRPHLNPDKVLQRCISCNVLLVNVEKQAIEHRVPEFVFHTYARFKVCPSCNRIYWEGSHTEHMAELLREVIGA